MSINNLLNQTIVIYSRTSYNAEGREVLGTGTSVRSRFQAKNKNIKTSDGRELQIVAIVYVPAATTVNIDDKITYGGNNYKVFSKYAVPDRTGNTNHIKLELLKWQI